MEKKEARSNENIKRLFHDKSALFSVRTALDTVIPELAESEDEKIREWIIDDIRYNMNNEPLNNSEYKKKAEIAIAWLEKQSKHQQLYIRFGDIPPNEKSKIYRGEEEIGTENGVSVYPAFEFTNGNIVIGLNLPITKTTLYTQQHLIEYNDRPCYLVKGDYIGNDSDGQPLINNISIIKKIDNYRIKENIKPIIEKQASKSKWSDEDEQYLLVCKNALHKYQWSDKWDADIISKWLEDKLKQGKQKPLDAAENIAKAVTDAHPTFNFKVGLPDEYKCPKWFEKQDEKPHGKTALEMAKEEKSPAESLGISPEKYEEIVNECIYGESTDKFKPKFKVGDNIKTANEEPLAITKIDDKGYWSEDLFICDFDESVAWELVDKAKPKFNVGDWVKVSTTKGDRIVQIASVEYFKNGYPSYITTEGRWFGNGTKARLLTNKDMETIILPESKLITYKNKEKHIMSDEKDKPKFKVGDTIIKKRNSDINKFGQFTITDITGGKYWYNGRIICDISEQYEWELVEQKPADKVEPKFHEGDWVINRFDDNVWHIDSFDKKNYQVSDGKGNYNWFPISKQDEMYLWTINNAKDGDVLSNGDIILIFKEFETPAYKQHIIAYLDNSGHIQVTNENWMLGIDKAKPATKEQRDLFFQKMKEAGWRWDAEKKELNPINEEVNGEDYGIDSLYHAQRILEKTLSKVEGYQSDDGILEHKCAISAVKKLYEQKPVEWSEEDEKMFRSLHNLIYVVRDCDCDSMKKRELSDWLIALKDRVQSKQKQKWDKEDEKCIRLSIDIIDSALRAGFCVQLDRDRCVDWLKSLKPQKQWKPTEEQIQALKEACDEHWEPDGLHLLYTLYERIKQL